MTPLALVEQGDQRVDLLLVRPLAAGVDARARGVADPQHDLVGPRRVVDQHRRRIDRVEVPP